MDSIPLRTRIHRTYCFPGLLCNPFITMSRKSSFRSFGDLILAGAIGGLLGALVTGFTLSTFLNTERRAVVTPLAPPAIGPYSQAIIHGDTVYVSGCIPLDTEGNMIGDTAPEQTVKALENMAAILEAAGSSREQVLKCTVLLTTMEDYAEVNRVYSDFFGVQNAPARAAFAVKGLPKNSLVEIECIAAISSKK